MTMTQPSPLIIMKNRNYQEYIDGIDDKGNISINESRRDTDEETNYSSCTDRDRSSSVNVCDNEVEVLRGRLGILGLNSSTGLDSSSSSGTTLPKLSVLSHGEKPSGFKLGSNSSFYRAKSSDFILDRLGRSGPLKMSEIERGLYLGNNDAATDVLLLKSNRITHVVTVDTVPLPGRIMSLLPHIRFLYLRVCDLPEEDILSHLCQTGKFISVKESKKNAANVLVHCYRGKSRSAAVVIAYIMKKYSFSLEKAHGKVKKRREIINPNPSFLAQLKLYENMNWSLDENNVQYRMFKLRFAAEKMRKAKVLFRDVLDSVLDPNEEPDEMQPVLYKCKRCKTSLASSFNLLPHLVDQNPSWSDSIWSTNAEDVLDSFLKRSCSASVFVNPIRWMQTDIKSRLSGKLKCPNCKLNVGGFSWVRGEKCSGCLAHISPAFRLDITEIIFRTRCRYLQSPSSREPVIV